MESQSVSKNKVENIGNKNIPQPFIVYQCISAGQTHQFWELGPPPFATDQNQATLREQFGSERGSTSPQESLQQVDVIHSGPFFRRETCNESRFIIINHL